LRLLSGQVEWVQATQDLNLPCSSGVVPTTEAVLAAAGAANASSSVSSCSGSVNSRRSSSALAFQQSVRDNTSYGNSGDSSNR
jgi:hypothetical protein